MAIRVSTTAIDRGGAVIDDLGDDVRNAFAYLDTQIDGSQAWVKGVLMELLLKDHAEYVAAVDDGLTSTRKCLRSTSAALGKAGSAYRSSESDALERIRDLFSALEDEALSEPITSETPKRSISAIVPSSALVTPASVLSDPAFEAVWNVMTWPKYFTISHWVLDIAGKIINLFAHDVFQGRDPFEHAAHLLSGDWDKVAIAGDAFGHMGHYYREMSNALNDAAVDILTGWSDGEGAAAAGDYFAKLVEVMGAQTGVYKDLSDKYRFAAFSAFSACQTVLSAVDALIDAVIAAALTGKTIGEVLAAPLTGGVSLAPATISAALAVVQTFGAARNTVMTAVTTMSAVGAGLGSARLEIEFIQLPEV